MRVLTVRQPWAWAIIHGGKDVENRARSLGPYRGLVAIHAGLKGASFDARHPELWPFDERHITGLVIGVVDLTGAHSDDDCLQRSLDQIAALYREDPATVSAMPDSGAGGIVGKVRPCSPWAMPDHHHLVLEDPRPLARPIPATGRLGLWRPDAALEAAIREQIGEA